MTCKDCLHYEACVNHYTQGQLTMINGDCSTFTDSSEWVYLPCKVGDKFFYIGSYSHNGELTKECSVMESQISSYGKLVVYDLDGLAFSIEDIFYTKEEAEKALEERNESKSNN